MLKRLIVYSNAPGVFLFTFKTLIGRSYVCNSFTKVNNTLIFNLFKRL